MLAGRPAGSIFADLLTSQVTGGLLRDQSPSATLDDARTASTGYDWTLGVPTTSTTNPGTTSTTQISFMPAEARDLMMKYSANRSRARMAIPRNGPTFPMAAPTDRSADSRQSRG